MKYESTLTTTMIQTDEPSWIIAPPPFWKIYLVIGYLAGGYSTTLAVKATQQEAEEVCRRRGDEFDDTYIEEWTIGQEREQEPENTPT